MHSEQIRIDLLGALEVSHTSRMTHASRMTPASTMTPCRRPVQITAAKLRQVLAMLAANANSMVSTDQLIDELWPDNPPSTVKTIVQTYVYQLRKLFGEASRSPNGTTLLTTRPGGYLLTVPRDNVDIFQFQELMGRGRAALRHGKPGHAAALLRESLALWRGAVLADIHLGPNLQGLSVYLEEQRLEAVSARIEADLADNRHCELVGELRRLVATHRLHESFHIRLMQALHRSGRRGEALTVYHQLRGILDQDLGLEPSSEAQQLQHEILNSH